MSPRSAKFILFTLLFILAIVYFSRTGFYHLRAEKKLSGSHQEILLKAAATSLQTSDVPIGAIILYGDSVLTTGFNTVRKDTNVAAHAEINAISNAIRRMGFEAFSSLDRNKLVLVSTFEPCMMCQGAILEYGIRHVYFMKGKGLFHWLTNDAKQFRYEWNKRQTEGEEMQDSLFLLHPVYREKNQAK